MRAMFIRLWRDHRIIAVALCTFMACVSSTEPVVVTPPSPPSQPSDVDGDPLGLLPGRGALAILKIDNKAMSQTPFGEDFAKLVDTAVPLGPSQDFIPSRDIDEGIVAAYAMDRPDFLGIIRGRFNDAAIEGLARAKASAGDINDPATLTEGTYLGRTFFAANHVGFAVLSDKTLVIGTDAALRRTLDRIQNGQVSVQLPSFLTSALDAPGSQWVAAADLTSQDTTTVAVGTIRLPWLNDVKTGVMAGLLQDTTFVIAGDMTYSDPLSASNSAYKLQQLGASVKVMAAAGAFPKIESLEITNKESSVHIQVALNNASIGEALKSAKQTLAPSN